MSSRRAALVLTFAALSGAALGACGGNDELTDSVPKSTPDLTVPRDASVPIPAVEAQAKGFPVVYEAEPDEPPIAKPAYPRTEGR